MNQAVASTRKLMKIAESALQKNRAQEAFDALQQLVAMNPMHAEALHKIGFILHGSGNYQAASEYYQRAINADPQHLDSYRMMCKILDVQNRGNEAMQLAQYMTQIAPNNPEAHATFMSMLIRFDNAHLVPDYMERVMPQFPNAMELHKFYCIALKVNYRWEEAEAAYRKLNATFRVPIDFRILYETYLPRINMSAGEIDGMRATFKASLEKLIADKPRLDLGLFNSNPVFLLAFHNRDNKELSQLFARMLRTCAPVLNYVAPHCKVEAVREPNSPIRIGFVSRHMFNHSVGSCYRGVMLALAAQPEFAVTFFNLSNVMDDKIAEIAASGMRMVSLPLNVSAIYEVIAKEKLDILIYPDIGMDMTTSFVAMARLARYQCCFQGHPDTTGIDTMDYFISSRSYEPPHGDENYTERLLCNEAIDTIFKRPVAPARWLSRAELGLPADKKLYVCPMAIQKFHPDFDGLLANILARDPNAVLVLFNDFQQQATSDMLKRRILSKCDASRVIFLGWQPLDALFSIMKEADAILDTIYFGAGTTSQYAFGFGFPIVTMPANYVRGRIVYSYYSVMGIENAPLADSPEEYVELAVKLANDAAYKQSLQAQILAKNHLLWDGEPYAPRVVQLMKDIMNQQLDSYRR